MLKCSNVNAFTIIEMMIVLFIISLISTMIVVNYRTGQVSSDIITEAHKIVGIFKQAQSWALTGYEVDSSRPDRGYGIYIEYDPQGVTTYTQFADTSATSEYQYDASDAVIQAYDTAPNIKLISTANCSSLVFKPPEGAVYCDGVLLESGTGNFTIWHTGENRYLYIKVNPVGQINIVSSL